MDLFGLKKKRCNEMFRKIPGVFGFFFGTLSLSSHNDLEVFVIYQKLS